MRIATWNVNSVNARIETVLRWFEEAKPDVACLQEIKCVDEKFPAEAFERLGYNIAVHGQKTYNGVALLSKHPLEDVRRGLPGDDGDEQARYVEAVVSGPEPVRVGCLYLPNGNPVETEKFAYKLAWMDRLNAHARELLALEERFLLLGDYNVIPERRDAEFPDNWVGDALFRAETRGAFRALKNLGLTEAFLDVDGAPGSYTFWDYQAGAWERNNGIRIDHALLSPQAADALTGASIHRHVRAWEKPSDHVPLVVELDSRRVLEDGFHDVADGKIADIVTSLQMFARPAQRPEIADPPWILRRLETPTTAEYLDLYRAVGRDWLWFTRLVTPTEQLMADLRDPAVEIYRLEAQDNEVGILELDFRQADTCELVYFGVSAGLIGGGAARWMMNRAIEMAWSRPIRRFWVHTCTLDAPGAPAFYIRSGFAPFRRQVEIADDPRLSGLAPLDSAPHVPVIRPA